MCVVCWRERGAPTTPPEDVDEVVGLVGRLYEMSTIGGPLHVIIDDWNIDDGDLDVGKWNDGSFPVEMVDLAERIVDRLREMTVQQRAVVLAHCHGVLPRGRPRRSGRKETDGVGDRER